MGMTLLQVCPLPSTDVLSYIAERASYSEQMVAEIAGQVLDALEYIQWRGKVYLNLEPANILVTFGRSLGRTAQVKLANFETTQTVASNGTQIKGTYNFDYAAPEIIEEAKAFPQSDVWSLGVLLYVLMSGQHPSSQIQVRMALQGMHHGRHKASHVDLQKTTNQTSNLGGGWSPQVDEPSRLHAQEETES